jgi:SHS2 domain-containing protein
VTASWEHFPHDADVGLIATGPTKAEAFRQAALALTAVMTDPAEVRTLVGVPVTCRASDDDMLLVDWLNALVFEMSTRDMLFGDFSVEVTDDELHATAWGERVDLERHEPAVEVKGATLTALSVRPTTSGWRAQCVVDV